MLNTQGEPRDGKRSHSRIHAPYLLGVFFNTRLEFPISGISEAMKLPEDGRARIVQPASQTSAMREYVVS